MKWIRRWREKSDRRLRLKSHLFASISTLLLVVVFFAFTHAAQPRANKYFRDGDPVPVTFPTLTSKTRFSDLKASQGEGTEFEVGFEWKPKDGPFDDIKAEPVENEPAKGAPVLCTQYQVRPQFLQDFHSNLHLAFANQPHHTESDGGEVWPLIRGSRVTLKDGEYFIYPLEAADAQLQELEEHLKKVSIILCVYRLCWSVSLFYFLHSAKSISAVK